MCASLSIKNVPEEVLHRLRTRAERNRRSLQMELLAIVEEAAFDEAGVSVDELVRHGLELGLATPDEATGMIRDFRDDR